MSGYPLVTEINITRQARALAYLRLTDYALVLMCGLIGIGLLGDLVHGTHDAGSIIFELIAVPVLCFAAYTGWRHVGVIDPTVWKSYRIVFPALGVLFLCLAVAMLAVLGPVSSVMNKEEPEAVQELTGLFTYFWIAAVSLLGWVSLMLLRRMKISGTDATVDKVLARLMSKAGAKAEQVAKFKPINKRRGLILGAAGALLLLAITFAPDPQNKILAQASLRGSKYVSLLGFYLLVRARRYFQIDADSLLAVDHRAPILFLRSFDDDEKQAYSRSDKALLDFSLETRLCNHFARFGPFVAIGSPKETVPQLGAARVLLSDDEWQPRVLGWMRASSLIIMYSGKTHWVNWELGQVLESGCATRLILMMPEIKQWRKSKRLADISERAEQIREVFKASVWKDALAEFQDFAGLRALLFRPDGSVVAIKSRSYKRDSYHLAALIAHEILLDGEIVSEAVPARVPVAAQRHVWRYVVGTAVATVLLCVVVGYAFFGPSNPQAAVKPAEPAPSVVAAHPAVERPAAVASVKSGGTKGGAALVPAAVTPAHAKPVVVSEQPENKGLRHASAEPITVQTNAALEAPPQQVAVQTVAQQAPPPDPTVAMLQNAEAALNAGRLVAPVNDCALYWVQQLKQNGSQQGVQLEGMVLGKIGKEIDSARASGNYPLAISDADGALQFYPGSNELITLRAQIVGEQQRAIAASQIQKFVLQHRHVIVASNGNLAQAYCVGILAVAPNGMASFDCTMTFDPQGRCDHLLFQAGTIKEVKFLKNGLLHVATDHMVNFDFYGDAPTMQGAYSGLAAISRK